MRMKPIERARVLYGTMANDMDLSYSSISMDLNVLSSEVVETYPEYGYIVKRQVYGDSPEPTTVDSGFSTIDGGYIGDLETTRNLCVERGIRPMKRQQDHTVCSVGYSVTDGKWYGWSHRAIMGYAPGQILQESDISLNLPIGHETTLDDCKNMAHRFAESVSSVLLSSVEIEVEAEDNKVEIEIKLGSEEKEKADEAEQPEEPESKEQKGKEPQPVEAPKETPAEQGNGPEAVTQHGSAEPDCSCDVDGSKLLLPAELKKGTNTYLTKDEVRNYVKAKPVTIELHGPSTAEAEEIPMELSVNQLGSMISVPNDKTPSLDGMLLSHSATDVQKYEWYRYMGDRKKSFMDSHPKYDLELERSDIIGLLKGTGDKVYIVPAEDTSLRFTVTNRQAQLLLKVLRPYSGKVNGRAVTKGSGSIEPPLEKIEIKKKTTKDMLSLLDEPSSNRPVKPGTIVHKLSDSTDTKPRGSQLCSLFMSDRSDRNYYLVLDSTLPKLKEQTKQRMIKAVDPSNTAKIIYLPSDNPFVMKASKNQWLRITKQQADVILKAALKPAKEFTVSLVSYEL